MTQQMEFDWTRADQLAAIGRAQLPKVPGVSPAAMKSVLRAIDSFGRGREAYPSEQTLSISCNLGTRTIRRALRALEQLSVLIIERRGALTLNHYRIVWTELALLTAERPDTVADRGQERPAILSERPAILSERPAILSERPAILSERPAMVASKPSEKCSRNDNNNQAKSVVVVSLEEVGIVDPVKTYSLAQSILQLTDEQILERIAHWRSLPADHPHRHSGPGVLHRWLTRPRSWHSPTTEQPKLQLRKLRDCTQENLRAELIRYGKSKGWTHQQLQTAVMRLEDECLRSDPTAIANGSKEESCQQQPESRDANQIALIRTERPLNRKF